MDLALRPPALLNTRAGEEEAEATAGYCLCLLGVFIKHLLISVITLWNDKTRKKQQTLSEDHFEPARVVDVVVRPPGPRPAWGGCDAAVGEVTRVVALREAPVGRRRHRRRRLDRRRVARSLSGTETKAAIDGRAGAEEGEAEREPIFLPPPPLFARPNLMGLFLQR